jgi:TPR repeat protein
MAIRPGMKDGMPVNVRPQVEVNFRLLNVQYDSKEEQQRTSYSAALANLQTPDLKPAALNTIEELASDKAMSLLGKWKIDGSNVAKDVPAGLDLIRKAADKFDGGALFELARFSIDGQIVPANPEDGMKLMVRSSFYGNGRHKCIWG